MLASTLQKLKHEFTIVKSGIFNDLEIFFNDGFLFNVVKSVDNVWSMISSFLYDVDTGKSIKYTNMNNITYCST